MISQTSILKPPSSYTKSPPRKTEPENKVTFREVQKESPPQLFVLKKEVETDVPSARFQ